MKKTLALIVALLFVVSAIACGGGKSNTKQESAGVEKLVADYGFRHEDHAGSV